MSFSGGFGYNDFRPFLSLPKDGVPHENTPRNKKTMKYFPLDPKKHPVTVLHEYCSIQDIEPLFQFYEIPQTVGIEYGCVVKVDKFSGLGRSFSKKTAKQLAASDILNRILQPNYYGDENLKTKRFVSETGIVSVHYEEKMDVPITRRSCFKSANKSGSTTIKKVKFLDANNEDVRMDEAVAADQTDLPLSDTETELMYSDEEDTHIQTEKPKPVANDSPKLDGVKIKIENEEDSENSPLAAEQIVGEIDDYLSQRLLRTKISHPIPIQTEDADSSDEVEVVKFSDPKRRKRKCSSPVPFEKALDLKRKVCFRDLNPVGYLQEACQRLRIPLPEYINLKEHGTYKSVCILDEHKEFGKGVTPKAAKKKAAALMIEHKGW